MNKTNPAVTQLLEVMANERAQIPEPDEPPGPFVFNEALDADGIQMESRAYASTRCRKCNGRGYVIYMIPGKVKARNQQLCRCVTRFYEKKKAAAVAARQASVG